MTEMAVSCGRMFRIPQTMVPIPDLSLAVLDT